MMDHKVFVAGLQPGVKSQLTRRSTRRGLVHLAGHLGLLVLGAAWILNGWFLWQGVLMFYGIALVFLFTLEHECTHQTPFANQAVNEWVGRLCGLVLMLPFEWFRYFHLAHHRWTNIPGKDPEIASPRPETWSQYLWYVSGLPFWGVMLRQTVTNALGRNSDDFLPARAQPRIQAEARVMLALYALVLTSLLWSSVAFWLWIFPAVVGQPFLRLYLLAEHGRCPPVANMFANTRTTYTSRMVRFLAWNMPYHAEHHIYPAVPFHQLPNLHKLTQLHLKVTAEGYVVFSKDYIATLGDKDQ